MKKMKKKMKKKNSLEIAIVVFLVSIRKSLSLPVKLKQ